MKYYYSRVIFDVNSLHVTCNIYCLHYIKAQLIFKNSAIYCAHIDKKYIIFICIYVTSVLFIFYLLIYLYLLLLLFIYLYFSQCRLT